MDYNSLLFKAAFFAEFDIVRKLLKTKDDLYIKIAQPEGYGYPFSNSIVNVNVLDVLNWGYYGLYKYCNKKMVCVEVKYHDQTQKSYCVNIKRHITSLINCINYICERFLISNFYLKDYSYYRPLMYTLDDDEEWFGTFEEISEVIEYGYANKDIDLMNYAIKGNGIKCYELIKEGAKSRVKNRYAEDEYSIEDNLHFRNGIKYNDLIEYLSEKEKFNPNNIYYMLETIHSVGVSSYILDILSLQSPKKSNTIKIVNNSYLT